MTKFGADWLIFVDARVLTENCGRTDGCRTDGHQRTVSDHNSLVSTLCSGKLTIGSCHTLCYLVLCIRKLL